MKKTKNKTSEAPGGFSSGDLVMLKSGGPAMTVVRWEDNPFYSGYRTRWQVQGSTREDVFEAHILKPYTPEAD